MALLDIYIAHKDEQYVAHEEGGSREKRGEEPPSRVLPTLHRRPSACCPPCPGTGLVDWVSVTDKKVPTTAPLEQPILFPLFRHGHVCTCQWVVDAGARYLHCHSVIPLDRSRLKIEGGRPSTGCPHIKFTASGLESYLNPP
jgi:hypothetical protein